MVDTVCQYLAVAFVNMQCLSSQPSSHAEQRDWVLHSVNATAGTLQH